MQIQNSKFKIQNSCQGFTLIETIIYLAIVSIILVSISYLIIDIINGQTKGMAGEEVNYNLRFVSYNLTQDIKAAQAINSLSTNTLVLTMPGDDVTYNFDTGNLNITRQLGALPVEILNTDQVAVSGSFTNHSYNNRSHNVGVELVVEYKNPSNLASYNASSTTRFTVELRGRR